jgi:hypothetical protein
MVVDLRTTAVVLAFFLAAYAGQASAEETATAPKTGETPKAATVPAAPPAIIVSAEDTAASAAEARLRLETDRNLRELVRRLGTPGWRSAQAELMKQGRAAVPYLIEAVGAPEKISAGYPLPAPGRAARTSPLSDVAYQALADLFQNHSTFQGTLPGRDQKAWQEFWTAYCASVEFGK